VIYLDSSVVLARLFAEVRSLPDSVFQSSPVSSRLLEYEVWNRIHARHLTRSLDQQTRDLIGRIALTDLIPAVLSRALEPFPTPVRTLDALHLASMAYLREQGQEIALASFDKGLNAGARALGIPLYEM
jgi:predicted nucleic acid-binding protein